MLSGMPAALRYLAFAAVSVIAAAGCKRDKAEIDGIGEYRVGVTTVADGAVCTPRGDITWCSHNPGVAIGQRPADVDLYFAGTEESSKLSEILVSVKRCDVPLLVKDLEAQLGPSPEISSKRMVWRNSKVVIVAQLPVESGRCEVNFLANSETDRIARLTGQSSAPAPEPSPSK
jgi:hypothetical protein